MLANKETGSIYGDPAPHTAAGQDLCGTVKGLHQQWKNKSMHRLPEKGCVDSAWNREQNFNGK